MKLLRVSLAGVVLALGLASAARADLVSGLVSYWPLDDLSGATTTDYGSSNVVHVTGAPTLVTGQFSNAFAFPTTPVSFFSTAFQSPAPLGLPIYKSPAGYTVAFWVKGVPQTTTRYLFSESSTNTTNPVFAIETGTSAATGSKIGIFLRTDAGTTLLNNVISTSVAIDNNWHHVAWTDNKGNCALYIDGNLDATTYHYTPGGTYAFNATTIANLVRTTISAAFIGTIDDVGAWQRPLTQAEIQQFMSNSIPLPIVQSKPSINAISPDSTNFLGDYVNLSVTAVGAFPITYQWYLDGTLLDNQTSNTLAVTTFTTPRTNVFTVVSSNYIGTTTNDIVITVPPDPASSLTNQLVSYWPLDTITNTDTSTNTPDLYSHDDFQLVGTNNTPPVLTTGEFANGLAFDASQLQYGASSTGTPVFDHTNYSISMWVQGQPGAQLRVFSQSSTTTATPLFTIATDPSGFLYSASVYVRNDANTVFVNNLDSSGAVFDGNWHHLVWTDQNGHALLYIDGVLDPVSFSYNRTGTFSFTTTAIGAIDRATVGNYYSGNIDEVAVWNRRLTYTEIQALQSVTLPAPTQINPPSIDSFSYTPSDTTNNLYAADTLTFHAQVSGTLPITYQWLKDGQPISATLNPTASTSTLVISNIQPGDNGAYSLSVSNGDPVLPGGAVVLSGSVQATVQPWTPVTNGLALDLDIDALGFPDTEPGFQMFNSSLNALGFTNALKVTIAPFGTTTALADRLRNAPPHVSVDGPGLTQSALYNDFLFDSSTNANVGLTITLERLAPNTQYGVIIWSFDPSSLAPRISDWTEISSGTPIIVKKGYSFDGNVLPVADYDDTLGGLFTSTAAGKLQFQAVNSTTNLNGVASFVNAIQLVANPVVSIPKAALNPDGNFQLTVQGKYPGESVSLQSSYDLTPGSWQPVTTGVTNAVHGPMVTIEIPLTTNQQFFRAQGN